MKKLLLFVLFACTGSTDVIYALDMHDVQCKLERGVFNSDLEQVRLALNQGARAHKKIMCIENFKGKNIADLADERIAHWKKTGNAEKLEDADKVRDTVVGAIGRELSGQGAIRMSPLF